MLYVFWRSGGVTPRHARTAWIVSPFDGRFLACNDCMASAEGPSEVVMAAGISERHHNILGKLEGGKRSWLVFGRRLGRSSGMGK